MASRRLGLALRDLGRAFDQGGVSGFGDRELLERFASRRDGAAFEAIVARHGPMVLATCRGVLRDRHAAEDAFQATFLTLARKAGSLRTGAALAAWLHRVARRVAIQADADLARRRRRETWSPALEAAEARTGPPADDSRPLVHEEIDRLPERYRAPIVLCYLEGLTHEQAAGQLRCPVGTVASRVVRGRELMRARLLRRGLGGAALGLASTPGLARSAVPEAWARSAVAAATGGPAPAVVVALSRSIIQGMLMTKLKFAATAALAASTLLMAGVVAAPGRLDPRATPTPKPSSTAPEALRPSAIEPSQGGEVTITGRVLDPTGKPVAGAAIRLDYYAYFEADPPGSPIPSATSGPDGRFSLRSSRLPFDAAAEGRAKRAVRILASAPGFGPAWASPGARSDALHEVTLRLSPDDLPILGRVVDLEGRPIAGASIRTTTAWVPPGDDLSAWIEGARDRGDSVWVGLDQTPLELAAATGPDGRFRLDGIGRERVVDLLISGPGIATATTFAMTRAVPSFPSEARDNSTPKTRVYHGSSFEYASAPTRPIVGVVRDKDTGRPLAGVTIEGMVYDGRSLIPQQGVEAVTDAEGRYRLLGLPGGAPRYRIMATPPRGQPYLNAAVDPAAQGALDPATCDIAIKRGVLVRGRVTDKATGQPVRARVKSFAFVDNPHVADYPGYRSSDPREVRSDPDGRFAVVALPGRGLIAAYSGADRYLQGLGSEAIAGFDAGLNSFRTLPFACTPSEYQWIAEISPGPTDVELTRDIELDPGRTLRATALDPEGRPLAGSTGSGLGSVGYFGNRTLDSPDFQVTGVDRRRPRLLFLWHEGRKLAGSAPLLGDEPDPLTVRLQPWGVVTGRLVDEEGRPWPDLVLIDNRPRSSDPWRGLLERDFPVDAGGRFRVEGLVPGLRYQVRAVTAKSELIGEVFGDLRVGPGESKDVGDVVFKRSGPR